ncbi:MAG TPA: cyclophilin-like fold protein [Syntrophales bacterium]|nr:cyclophilin-like fold protein [Syntrophales bacterium]HOX93525.1 cyclophilin-like fold protein [Syntrophales bacterium]HPI56006.1 cyclophilin-like fold protein [Syntrophales bacterium]HPN24104.1 cyclophilin-like fold protein [Syntrophales bacterium]HQM28383.1 cyclophilin-like fold protein [Syntrophales bacterium]
MPQKIKIFVGQRTLEAQLFDTACAKAIFAKLPIEAKPNEWGDEFYFSIGLKMPPDETSTTNVKVGHIGYWPPGTALAIFFGRTPMSAGPDPVPASEVNIVGTIIDDATILKKEKGASKIRIEKA